MSRYFNLALFVYSASNISDIPMCDNLFDAIWSSTKADGPIFNNFDIDFAPLSSILF